MAYDPFILTDTTDPFEDCGDECIDDCCEDLVLSSKPYALLDSNSSSIVDTEVTDGMFYIGFRLSEYAYAESTEIISSSIPDGVFRKAIKDYDYTESTEITATEIPDGSFRVAIKSYSYTESSEITETEIPDGIFRVALITYENGLTESTEITGSEITEGSHATS